MEVNIHSSSDSTLTAQNVSSALQSSILQIPQATAGVMPLNSATGPVCLFPVSVISQPQMPPLQNQTEPILLLPASALSLSMAQTLSSNASLLNTKLTSASPLQQQLLFNNVLIKPPAPSIQIAQTHIQQEAASQSIIVLPLGTNENLCQATDRTLPEKKSCENKSIHADSTDPNPLDKWLPQRTSRRKSTKISEICSMRENITSKKLTTSIPTQSTSLAPSAADYNRTHHEQMSGSLNNSDISQIISSLPPGWQVIGLTGLDQVATNLPVSSFSDCSPLPQPSQFISAGQAMTASTLKPSLVCVNLNNVSQPVASKAFDSSAVNELTCSVKLDDIPCTHVISIKTERIEDEKAKPDSTSDDQSIRRSREKWPVTRKSRGGLREPQTEKSGKAAKKCSSETGVVAVHNVSEDSKSTAVDEQWKIVGVTSLPHSSVKELTTINNTATVTSSSSDSSQSLDDSSDTIILKIPICPSSTSKGKRKTNKLGTKLNHLPVSVTPFTSVNESKKASVDNDLPLVNKSEDMKWTIVGLTQTPLSQTDTTLAINHILQNSQPFQAGVTAPGPLTSNSTENIQTNHLFNLISTLPSTNQLLIQPNLSAQNGPSVQQEAQTKAAEVSAESQRNDQTGSSPDKSEWKVVGLTPLGLPTAPVNPFTQVSPFQNLSSILPVPLLIPTATSLSLPIIRDDSSPSVCRGLSSNTLPTVTSQVASPIMNSMVGLAGASTSVILPSPVTPCFNQFSTSDIETFQALRYQHGLENLLQNNAEKFQHPLNLFTNDSNNWTLGMLNSQVPILTTDQLNAQDLSINSFSSMTKLKDKLADSSSRNSTVKHTLVSRFKGSDTELKLYKSKSLGKFHESEHIKKNTVSSLLRMKRMQKGRPESCHDSIIYMDVQDKSEVTESKMRSLRSYAGSCGVFGKGKEHNEKIRLRSGAQASEWTSNVQETERYLGDQNSNSGRENCSQSQPEEQKQPEVSPVKVETHSAARKRKLKVPRRMVAADTDYHPFDTSSDSN